MPARPSVAVLIDEAPNGHVRLEQEAILTTIAHQPPAPITTHAILRTASTPCTLIIKRTNQLMERTTW